MEYRALLVLVLIILIIGSLSMMSVEMMGVIKGEGRPQIAVAKVTGKILVAFLAFVVLSKVDHRIFEDRRVLVALYILTMVLLMVVLLNPASERNNSRRWIVFGEMTFQPSEIAKIFVILLVAWYVKNYKASLKSFTWGILVPILMISPIMISVLLEPDLSTTLILFLLALLMVYTAGAKAAHVLLVLVLVGVLFFVGVKTGKLKSYQLQRLKSFFEGRLSEQVLLALESAKSGGALGKGMGLGEIKLLVPVVGSDFILAVVGEELGYIGIAILLLSYLGLVYVLLKSAEKSIEDDFGKMIVLGYGYLIMLQVMVNVGVTTGILPTTGVTLPFVSSGGSSLLAFMSGLGIVVNVLRGEGEEG